MKCPYCSAENREDREACYHCGKDISMLRLIVNKARHHFNVALEHAERQRFTEALAELEHCIELDRSFVAAHVVMGTVCAKMEKFDEAERCWRAALALDPHIQKAQDYLDKSHLARQALPLLRKLRWLFGAAIATIGLFVVLLVWNLRPTADAAQIEKITADIKKGDFHKTLGTAEHLEESAHSHEVRRTARLLQDVIRQRYELASIEMFSLILNDKPVEAHQLYQRIAAGADPPEPYNRQLTVLDQKAAEKAVEMVEDWRRQSEQGHLEYDELVRRIIPFNQAFVGDAKVTAKTAETLLVGRRAWAARILAQVPISGLSTTQTIEWVGRVGEVAKHAPESSAEVTSAALRLVAAALGPLEARMKEAVAAKNPDDLRSAVSEWETLVPFGVPLDTSPVLQQARADLRQLETDRFTASLSGLTSADIPKLDALAEAFARSAGIDMVQDSQTSAAMGATRRRLAALVVTWCSDRSTRFGSGGMTPEEAKWILDRAEFALQYYAGKTWRRTRDLVMFCAALAAAHTDDSKSALAWVDRLEKAYPESSYLAQARRLRPAESPDVPLSSTPQPE